MTVIRGKFGRPREDEPQDPQLVADIIYLRDNEDMTWRDLGDAFGMSHQNPYLLYKRWRDWYYEEEQGQK
jgi:hypothetical protein